LLFIRIELEIYIPVVMFVDRSILESSCGTCLARTPFRVCFFSSDLPVPFLFIRKSRGLKPRACCECIQKTKGAVTVVWDSALRL